MKPIDLVVLLPLCLVAPACSTFHGADSKDSAPDKTVAPATDAAKGAEDSTDDEKESTAEKVRKAEFALEVARTDLKIARQECQAADRKQKDDLDEAEYGVAKSKEALDTFQKTAKPLELGKLQLSLDRGAQGVEETRQELEEIMSMYKKEDFAALTKELVISRHKKRLEFAKLGLEMDRTAASVTRDVELPRKERDLDLELKKAEAALREARAAGAKLADENELKLKKAERAVDDAQRELDKLRAKAQKEAEKAKAAKS